MQTHNSNYLVVRGEIDHYAIRFLKNCLLQMCLHVGKEFIPVTSCHAARSQTGIISFASSISPSGGKQNLSPSTGMHISMVKSTINPLGSSLIV